MMKSGFYGQGFRLDRTNLEHRLKAPYLGAGSTILDEGLQAGYWELGANIRTISPDNVNIGWGVALNNALYRTSPTWMGTTQPCTIMFWSYMTPATTVGRSFCTGSDTGGFYSGHELPIGGNGGSLEFRAGDGGSNSSVHRVTHTFTSTDLRDSTWHHLAYSFNGITPVGVWVDGVAVANSYTSGTGTALGWHSGCRWQVNANGWESRTVTDWGQIADIRLYSEILSTARVLSIALVKS